MRLSAGLLIAMVSSSFLSAAEWPRFRGPTADGHSTAKQLPTVWSLDEGIDWSQAIPGKAWSSPVLADGVIYLTTAIPQGEGAKADQLLSVVKLDSKTGKILAEKQVFKQDGASAPAIHAKNSHASPTPIIADGKLYVHFGHSGTACLEAKSLEILWTNRDLGYKPVHGNGGSPLLHDGKLYISIDGTDRRSLVALEAATGKLLWETKRSHPATRPFSFGTPILITVNNTPMIVTTSSDGLYGYDPQTGKELWFFEYTGYSVVPVPLYVNGLLYVCTGYNTPSLLALKLEAADGQFRVSQVWRHRVDVPHNPSPIIVGNELYMVSDGGIATCLDAKTGKQHWRERLPGGYSASIMYGGGHLYFLNEQGVCTVIKPGTSYDFISTNSLKDRSLASPAVDGEALLIRTEKSLFRIKGK